MEELKEKLLNTGMINDNEYLDLYVSLIYNNRFTKSQKNNKASASDDGGFACKW